MPAPVNRLKAALAEGRMQVGVWLDLCSPMVAEMAAQAGFDWCLIDAEHGPNAIGSILSQLQAMNGAAATAVVRVPMSEHWMLKQVLDVGAQSIMVPMIETAAQATEVVRATRYPPDGNRGMGAYVARASGYSAVADYVATAQQQICVIAQIESRHGLANVEAIAAVEGVDCLFIGPADLAADLGHTGNPLHPEVIGAQTRIIAAARAAGKAAGILAWDASRHADYAAQGVQMLGVGGDVPLLGSALRMLAANARASTGG